MGVLIKLVVCKVFVPIRWNNGSLWHGQGWSPGLSGLLVVQRALRISSMAHGFKSYSTSVLWWSILQFPPGIRICSRESNEILIHFEEFSGVSFGNIYS